MEHASFEVVAPKQARWGAFTESEYQIISEALRRAYLTFVAIGMLNSRNADIALPALTLAVMHGAREGERDVGELAAYALREFDAFSFRVRPGYFRAV
jgi:hypothetical protein